MINPSTIYDAVLLKLPKIHFKAGSITPVNNEEDIPFTVKRVFYLYDIPSGEGRGGHAHHELYQLIVAASGSFDVLIDDGRNKKVVSLNRPFHGLLVVPGLWAELFNFSSGSISLVLASDHYDETDYIRNYEEFKTLKLNANE